MQAAGPDPIQDARALRSRLREQEGKLADLISACRQTVDESRRIIKKSRNALRQLKVVRHGGQVSGRKFPE